MYKKRYCTVVDIGVGVCRISKMLKFFRLSIYVMGKVLTGEVFCMQTGLDLPYVVGTPLSDKLSCIRKGIVLLR